MIFLQDIQYHGVQAVCTQILLRIIQSVERLVGRTQAQTRLPWAAKNEDEAVVKLLQSHGAQSSTSSRKERKARYRVQISKLQADEE